MEKIIEDYPDIMDIKQMCSMLNICDKTGYKFLKEKKIDYIKIGRIYRISKVSVLKYFNIFRFTI